MHFIVALNALKKEEAGCPLFYSAQPASKVGFFVLRMSVRHSHASLRGKKNVPADRFPRI